MLVTGEFMHVWEQGIHRASLYLVSFSVDLKLLYKIRSVKVFEQIMWHNYIFALRTMDKVEKLFYPQHKVIADYQNTRLSRVIWDLACGQERPLGVTGKMEKLSSNHL